jgi:hypothetical protein
LFSFSFSISSFISFLFVSFSAFLYADVGHGLRSLATAVSPLRGFSYWASTQQRFGNDVATDPHIVRIGQSNDQTRLLANPH